MAWGAVLDKCYWFSGPSRGDKGVQVGLVVKYANTMLRLNATQGLNEARPLIYKEALEQAKLTCQDSHCDDSLLLVEHFSGRGNAGRGRGGGNLNPAAGGSRGGGQAGGQKVGRGGGQGGGANLNGITPIAQTQSAYGSVEDGFKSKEKLTCMFWNMKQCRQPDTCPKFHKCSFKLPNGLICWDKVNKQEQSHLFFLTHSFSDSHEEDAPGQCAWRHKVGGRELEGKRTRIL